MKARPLRCPSEPPDVEMRREVTRTLIAHAVELPRPEPHPDLDLIGRTDRDQTSTRRRGPHHRRPARRGSGGALGPGYGRRRQAGASSELTLAEPGVRAHRTQERASKSSWVSGGLERIHGGQPTSDGGTPTGSDAEVWTTEAWCAAVWTIAAPDWRHGFQTPFTSTRPGAVRTPSDDSLARLGSCSGYPEQEAKDLL